MCDSTMLATLLDELRDVNRQLSAAARPLARISDLTDEQRKVVAAAFRAGLERWEDVSRRISDTFAREAPAPAGAG